MVKEGLALHLLEDPGRPHAAADAHRDHAVATVAAPHLVQQGGGELGAGTAERMAESDGAAIDIDPGRIEPESAHAGEGLGGKGFIELDEADLLLLQTGEAQS